MVDQLLLAVYGPAQGEVAHQAQEGAEVGFCEDDLERGGGYRRKGCGNAAWSQRIGLSDN
jgi:hypothetical protein